MKLFYKAGSCSLIAHIVAQEANTELELVEVDLQTGLLPDGTEFKTINPKGYVPCLLTNDDQVLTEAAVIATYVAAQNPDSTISPRMGSFAYFKMLEWLNYLATEVHKQGFMPLFMQMFGMNVHQTTIDFSMDRLTNSYALIENQLGKTTFLLGDNFTCADAYLYVTMSWADKLGIQLHRSPNLNRFFLAVKDRPAVMSAHAAEAV